MRYEIDETPARHRGCIDGSSVLLRPEIFRAQFDVVQCSHCEENSEQCCHFGLIGVRKLLNTFALCNEFVTLCQEILVCVNSCYGEHNVGTVQPECILWSCCACGNVLQSHLFTDDVLSECFASRWHLCGPLGTRVGSEYLLFRPTGPCHSSC